MNKKILLIEPAYKSKYPPLGLMKISTYHKLLGDKVTFIRGCSPKAKYQYWDRIYITTLFTWTWKETIKTIYFYRDTLFNMAGKCYVGGILASLMPDEIYNATGLQPIEGLLDTPDKIDQDDDIIIDHLPPDYDILKQVENDKFKYAYTDAYLGYATRGCVRNCDFCAVKKFEPEYIHYVDIKRMIKQIEDAYGEKKDLLLMDNNVLASNNFDDIIDDIKNSGFVKGARYGPTRKKRIVDFNQGLDARLLTEHKMKKLSEISLEPMRLGFDDINMKRAYIKAVRLAHKYGQANMSNYVLYNFKDTPEDFYERLKINIELNEEFKNNKSPINTTIYSFPMRYIPLDAKDRHMGTGNVNWNKRSLRSVQLILNVTKGPVMPGAEFFYQAFGRNINDFKCILFMPDEFIIYRLKPNWRKINSWEQRLMPYVRKWFDLYQKLNEQERTGLSEALGSNDQVAIIDLVRKQLGANVKKVVKYFLNSKEIVAKHKHAR